MPGMTYKSRDAMDPRMSKFTLADLEKRVHERAHGER